MFNNISNFLPIKNNVSFSFDAMGSEVLTVLKDLLRPLLLILTIKDPTFHVFSFNHKNAIF